MPKFFDIKKYCQEELEKGNDDEAIDLVDVNWPRKRRCYGFIAKRKENEVRENCVPDEDLEVCSGVKEAVSEVFWH